MELYKIFIRILKDLNCYQEYKKNFIRLRRYGIAYNNYYKCKTFKEFVDVLAKNRISDEIIFEYFINDSFDWGQTTQGFDYWCDINKKFKTIFRLSSNDQFISCYEPHNSINVDDGVIGLVKGYLKSQLINE